MTKGEELVKALWDLRGELYRICHLIEETEGIKKKLNEVKDETRTIGK